jgi:hypothetical protein
MTGYAAGFGTSARAPPSQPGHRNPLTPAPGRPPGSRNRRPALHNGVGKNTRRDLAVTAQPAG